jgi:archaeal flagellar protein FlaI
MAETTAPFAGEHGPDGQCPIHNLLPPPLRAAADEAPHLMAYLHRAPIGEFGMPDYYAEVSRKLSDIKEANLIYPVGKGTFVHIYPAPNDARNCYAAVEPGSEHIGELIEQVEYVLLDFVELLVEAHTPEEREAVLLKAIDDSCQVVGRGPSRPSARAGEAGMLKLPFGLKGSKTAMRVTQDELDALKYMVIRDKIGMGVLEPLLSDPWIEDVSCSGVGPVYIEHKIFGGLKSNIAFETHEEIDAFVVKLAEKIKKPVTFRNPIVDATLPDGSRINIVYGGDVSKNGSNFTIRKFMGIPLSIIDIANSGMLTYQMVGYLSLIVESGMNFFVSGETASGKTTLMNALMTFIPAHAKIVSIEDTPEVQVPHPNWTREVVRGAMSQSGGSVDMFSLLKAALRQRPNEIIIGEIRGEEGNIAFQAMMTGHAVCATFHAATVEKLIQRVTGAPISVPKTYVDNLNVVIIASSVRLPNGRTGRRIISISEIISYNPVSNSFSFVEVFRWNPVSDVFEFTGYMNSYLLEQRIARARGIPEKNRRQIYQEVDRRGALLEKLSDQGVTNFYELYRLLSRASRQGLF